jgi:Flp pilus assembly protein TadD
MAGMRERSATSSTRGETASSGDTVDPVRTLRERATGLALEGRFAESEACAREALRLRPDNADAMNELSVAVWHQGRGAEAEEILWHAARLEPGNPRVLTNLGLTLMARGRPDEAVDCLRGAVRIDPHAFDAMVNLGVAISNRGDFEGAMEPLLAAFALRPDSVEAVQYLGMNLARRGCWAEAIGHYERALRRHPDDPGLHRSLGFALLASGDFERGWPEHEWRLRCRGHRGCRVDRPAWDGAAFTGRTILLHFEQGFGDTLQFIRYTGAVKSRGGRVAVLCRRPLVRLLSRCEGVDLAFDGADGVEPECHLQAPLMSLPAIFGTTLGTIPARVPYLFPDPALVEHWREVLDHLRGLVARSDLPVGERGRTLLVGIVWQGDPKHGSDHWRSFPLARFEPLAALPGVRLVSLQVGPGSEQVGELAGRFPVVELPGRGGGDFDETAAIVAQLDLVIAPDTAVAHLAGGLGVPVWVPLSSATDWRWLVGRDDSPWYPTLRLIRQARPDDDDWRGVFDRMADELGRLRFAQSMAVVRLARGADSRACGCP